MQPLCEKPYQSEIGRENQAGQEIKHYAPPRNTGAMTVAERSETPEINTNLKIKNRTRASTAVMTAAKPSLRTHGSDCARRTASAGIAPLGDKPPDGPRTRRIFSCIAAIMERRSPPAA